MTQPRPFLAQHAKLNANAMLLDAQALRSAAREIGLRVLSSCLLRVGGARYRPRFERLEPLYDAIVSQGFADARTLAGCRVGLAPKARQIFGAGTLEIRRERAAKHPFGRKTPRQARLVTDLAGDTGEICPRKGVLCRFYAILNGFLTGKTLCKYLSLWPLGCALARILSTGWRREDGREQLS